MRLPKIYLSKLAVLLPRKRLSKDDVNEENHENYRGDEARWPHLELRLMAIADQWE